MASTEEQFRAKLEAAFKETDVDKSGTINHSELKNALRKAGFKPSDADIEFIIKEADKDNSGTLNFNEFASAMIAFSIRVQIAMELRMLFEVVDADGSGYITVDELKKLFQESSQNEKFSNAEIETEFKKADKDGNGQISFEEFVKVFSA